MAGLAWLSGTIAGLCMVMGIVTATGVIPTFGDELTWVFWFGLSAILFLATIAFTVGRGGEY
jgi:hypothetical protein